ncbi:MAG: AsmA family protein [Porticoccaceae bacterium]|nr:AsmA family protein [Porticoccaceae bacterium]
MNIFLKRLSIGLVSFALLIALGIFLATLLIDPNQFKPNIESAASNAGVELGIDGDLAWQFFPLGISVEKVNFVLGDKSMAASADQLSFGVNFSTLISLASQHKQLPISRLLISNGRVLYALPNSLPLQFSQINLSIDNVNSNGQKFPISLSLVAPKGLKISLNSEVGIKMSGGAITDLSIDDLELKVNKISIYGRLDASNNLSRIQGQLTAEPFDLIKQFKLAKRFVPDLLVPKMADANALTNISFDSLFDIETDGYSKIQTTLSIDGQPIDIDVDIDHQVYKLNTLVSGKNLDLSPYKTKSSANTNNSMLFAPLAIPMAVWHGQSQFELNFMSIELGKIKLSNLYANLFGNQNIFNLTSLNGDIFNGHLNATASLNLQNSKPSFSINSSVKDIDLSAFSASFDDVSIGGILNFEGNIQGSGATTESVLQSLDGIGSINIDAPTYKGVNLEQSLCNTAAIFGGKPIPKRSWSENTTLGDLTGNFRFKKDRLVLTDYETKLANIDIYGNADLNLSSLRYALNTTALATQPTSSANGCKINPMIVKREIPFKCKGALGDKFRCKPDNNLIQTLLLSPKL